MDTIIHEGKRFFRMSAPLEKDGKKLCYEEVFRSNYHEFSPRTAESDLNAIRECHDKEHGWVEIDAWIEHYPDGYVAVRYHAQYN